VPSTAEGAAEQTLPDTSLEALGWTDELAAAFEPHQEAGLTPGRVSTQHRGVSVANTEAGEVHADLAGRFRHEAIEARDLPAVGDWVALDVNEPGRGRIEAVLPRTSLISRKTPWLEVKEQVLATNVQTVFLVQALPLDVNPRRLERYLTTVWESGASPVIVLTKTDLAGDDLPRLLAEVEAIAMGVPVHAVCNITGEGLDALRAYVTGSETVVLLGSSGVGKSTIVNRLAGEELLETQEVRESDQRGRHTTTRRQLIVLPSGGIVLDTPGLRELQLWNADEGISHTFEDVEGFAAQCRFSDCAHESEPGCAVRAALASGELDRDRWDSYVKLQRELHALEARQNVLLRKAQVREHKIRTKAMRKKKR
jgi:ribosome biogenesis GTPase